MARFYNTSDTDFIDYISGTPVMQAGTRPASSKQFSSLFGGIEALPDDRAVLQQTVSEYEEQVDELTGLLQSDPDAVNRLRPQINKLRSDLRDEFFYGRIAAIRDRYSQAQAAEKNIRDVFKDNPAIMSSALQDLYSNIPDLGYDPATRQYGMVNVPKYVQPFTGKDRNDFIKSAEEGLKDKMLGQISDKQQISPTETLYTLGQKSGVTIDQARSYLRGLVTDDMVQAYQQSARLAGDPVDETQFFDENTGRFNMSTKLGRMMESIAQGLNREDQDVDRKVGRDRLREEEEKARQRKSIMRYGRELKAGDYENLATKFISVWEGEESAFDKKDLVDTYGEGGLTEEDEQMLAAIQDPKEREATRNKLMQQRGRSGGRIGKSAKIDNLFDGFDFTSSRAKGAPKVVQIIKRDGQQPTALVEQETREFDDRGYPVKVKEVGGVERKVRFGDDGYDDATEYATEVKREEKPFDVEFMRSMMPDEQFDFFLKELIKRKAVDPESQGVTVDYEQDVTIPGY